VFLVLLHLLLPHAAGAQVEFDAAARVAEVDRLREELLLLAQKNQWTGVERTYQAMVGLAGQELGLGGQELTGASLQATDHWNAAQAAANQGDAAQLVARLRAVLATGESVPGAREWLSEVARRYGRAQLTGTHLEPVALPFAPDEVAAIRFAQDRLAQTGVFEGMLPAGRYHLGGEVLVVRPVRSSSTDGS
jgi:hypothetical protein